MRQDKQTNYQQENTSCKTYNSQIIISFILGIISLILLFLFFPAGFASAIVGLVLNRKSSKQLNFMLRKSGFVISLLGVIFNGALFVACIIFLIVCIIIIL